MSNQCSNPQPLLQMNGAVVVRSGRTILNIDSFVLDEGQHLALLGPNGSGKSTFVKLMTREVFPLYNDNPPVLFRGSEKTLLTDIHKTLGVVSASMQDMISAHLPVIDVVCGGLFGALGVPHYAKVTPESLKQADKALDMLGIHNLRDRDVMTLSSGQARRVLVARSLVHNPDVLVFDEPCTGLDPQGMFFMRKSMRTLAQAGKTIVLVTHYPEDIIPEIQRVLMLKEGTVFADGNKKDLMTTKTVSALFDVPVMVESKNDYYSLVSEY